MAPPFTMFLVSTLKAEPKKKKKEKKRELKGE
jgi:hypothetical protein